MPSPPGFKMILRRTLLSAQKRVQSIPQGGDLCNRLQSGAVSSAYVTGIMMRVDGNDLKSSPVGSAIPLRERHRFHPLSLPEGYHFIIKADQPPNWFQYPMMKMNSTIKGRT